MFSGVLHTPGGKASGYNARCGNATVGGVSFFTWDADDAAGDFVG
jgi:hypothetical protein